jgi:uncharacterized delta-60 repeat protein
MTIYRTTKSSLNQRLPAATSKATLLLFSIAVLMAGGIAALHGQSALDGFDPNLNGPITVIVTQPDGKILIGGVFTTVAPNGGAPVPRNGIARLNADGTLDTVFDPNALSGPGGGIVLSIALQADGKILVGGFFSAIGGQLRNYLARLDPVTGLADSFNPVPNDQVFAIAVQADGKILAGGYFTTLTPNSGATVTRNRIARLEKDGRVDQTLNLNVVGSLLLATAVQPDGKILIGGGFTRVLGVLRNNIARLNTDGTLDLAFNPTATGGIYSITVQPDGKILVGGSFTFIGGQSRNNIARLNTDGTLDLAFNPGANGDVSVIAVQADGKILLGGFFSSIGGQTRNRIARLDALTGLVDSFDPNANGVGVYSIAVQADGKILAGGNFTSIGGQTRNYIARLNPSTGLADSFDPNASDRVYAIAVQADGKILVGGNFTSIGGQARQVIARVDGTSGLADSFDPNPNNAVYGIALQANGKILLGGEFTNVGGQTRNHIARLDPATALADSFDPNANDAVAAIAVQPDGEILAGGFFTFIGGVPRSLFARLSNDTAALQNLAATPTIITWTRGGSSPSFTRVTFEYSTDSVNFTTLGSGIPQGGGSNWTRAGLNLPTGQNLYIRARGFYSTGNSNGSESIAESVRNAFVFPQAAQPINLSTRLRVLTGDNVGIGGFIITGTAPKHVLLRAIGPSLTAFGIPNALVDPLLELHGPGAFITITNNNWRDTQESAIQASGLAPTNNFESAIDVTLAPGPYTAILSGNGNTSGGGLIEVFDMDPAAASKLANISTRAFVSTGDDIVIAGVILGNGGGSGRIVVRGIGPSLTAFGVPNALANPILELRNEAGTLVSSNNDWQDDSAQRTELIAASLAPSNSLESALVATLPPGRYTALLAGQANGTGVGLVEVYDAN